MQQRPSQAGQFIQGTQFCGDSSTNAEVCKRYWGSLDAHLERLLFHAREFVLQTISVEFPSTKDLTTWVAQWTLRKWFQNPSPYFLFPVFFVDRLLAEKLS